MGAALAVFQVGTAASKAMRRAMMETRRWLVLCVLLGTFMAILDVASVNVAIPSIGADLHASFGEIEFVVSTYTLTYACLLVMGQISQLGESSLRRDFAGDDCSQQCT
jgi:hypothetical protein